MRKMKRKFNSKSKKISKSSFANNKNIDLRISKISNGLMPNNLSPIVNRSRTHPKGRPKSKMNNSKIGVAYTVNKTRKMDWKQLKKKFPGMKPNADADFDGLVNARDCKPLDPSKDGVFSRFVGIATGGKKGQSAAEFKEEMATKKKEREFSMLAKKVAVREKVKVIAEKKAEKILEKKGYISETERERLAKRQAKLEAMRAVIKSAPLEKAEEKVTSFLRGRGVAMTQKQVAAARARREKGIVKAVERFAGVSGAKAKVGKAAKGQAQDGAGRPKQSYKYRDPRTGQPVSAVEYHKIRKQLKKQAKAVETKTEVQQRFALAKRGLSPEEVTAAQEEINARMARLRAIKEAKQAGELVEEPQVIDEDVSEERVTQEQIEQIPTQVVHRAIPTGAVPPQRQRIQRVEPSMAVPGSYGIPPGYRVRDDLMTGKKTLVPLPPQEAWSR